MAIKVSQKTIEQLRKGTKASNLAKAKTASPEMKEALKRFYGASAVSKAVGSSAKTVPSTKQTGSAVGKTKVKSAPSAATRMDKSKAKATGNMVAKSGGKSQKVSAQVNGKTVMVDYGTKPYSKPKSTVPAGTPTTRSAAVEAGKNKKFEYGSKKVTVKTNNKPATRKPTEQEKKNAALRAGGMK